MKRPYLLTPELKGWDCPAHDPISEWVPPSDEVIYWLVCHIGRPDEPGADLFTVPVVNREGLHSELWKRNRRPRSEPIVVEPYAWDGVLAAVQERLRRARARTWEDVWDRLRSEFAWEYEDMR